MRMELQKRSEKIKLLSQYKREDDIKEIYLENLIENHDLSNTEVKILQMLSAGFTEAQIAHKHRLSATTLEAIIKSMYTKIGIDQDEETNLL